MTALVDRYNDLYELFNRQYWASEESSADDLSEQEYYYLNFFAVHQQLTPSEFADLAKMTRAGATQLITKYEKRGWLIKERSAEDRRRVTVRLSEQMAQQLADAYAKTEAIYDRLLAVLTDAEKAQLEHLLTKLVVENRKDD